MSTRKTNAQCIAEITRNAQFANVVNLYRLLSGIVAETYESQLVVGAGGSYYNLYVKHNYGINCGIRSVWLAAPEAEQKACVVMPLFISHGSLAPIDLVSRDDRLVSSLRLPSDFEWSDAITVGEITSALLGANPELKPDDRITVVQLVQVLSGEGIPRAYPKVYQLTLSLCNLAPLHFSIPSCLFRAVNGCLGTDTGLEDGAVAYIRSRQYRGKISLSSQRMVPVPGNTLYEIYSSGQKSREALDSYGLTRCFIDPGDAGRALE